MAGLREERSRGAAEMAAATAAAAAAASGHLAAEAQLLVTAAVSSALRSTEAEGSATEQPSTPAGPAGPGAAPYWTAASVALPLEVQRLREENAALCGRISGLEESLAAGRAALGHSNSA